MTPMRWIPIALIFAVSHAAGVARAVDLVLENGWTDAPFSTSPAEAYYDNDMVYLRGAVAGGSSPVLFTLPDSMQPGANTYVSVDLCGAAQGRLLIQSDGTVSVQSASGSFAEAQCFTSLDGVKFASPGIDFDPLTLSGTWSGGPFGTTLPQVALLDDIVHLRGALAGGTTSLLFTLPVGRRPATEVYVPVNLCGGAKGRLRISPNGNVVVSATSGAFSEAQCFTSLDGVSFARSDVGFTPLTLAPGWTGAPFSTSEPSVENHLGLIRFKGAVAGTSGDLLFTLPAGFRPATKVYLPVDLCDGKKGRLVLEANGEVRVQSVELIGDAQCFTSLDGASFVEPPPSVFTPIALEGSWINGFFGTAITSVVLYDDIVYFKGAVSGGSATRIFTLPVTLRPARDSSVLVDLCGAAFGHLNIHASTGYVFVYTAEGSTTAPCFVSLEGASFSRSAAGFTNLVLANDWESPVYQYDRAAAKLINGIVHFRGAIANGSNPIAFTLPREMRPEADVYLPTSVCNATETALEKGRIRIRPTGVVEVNPPPLASGHAQCVTTLDGVKFAPSTAGFTSWPLSNGWTGAPFATSEPAATLHRDIVQLKGAIAGGSAATVFTLPEALRPETSVYIPLDLCNGAYGRLVILASGNASVQAAASFSDAQCFTSLDGASYAVPEPAVLPALIASVALLAALSRRTGNGADGGA